MVSSTASLMAMPSEPVLFGMLERGSPGPPPSPGWAGHDAGAVGLHHQAAVWLLVVACPNHVDLDFDPEHGARVGEGAAPLAGAGFGGDALDALFLVVEGLRNRGVGLVAAGRAYALVLVVDVGRRIERLLEPKGAHEGARSILLVELADRLRDLDLALGRDLLHDQRHREERRQIGRTERLVRPGMERRRLRHGQIRRDVVPGSRDLFLVQHETRSLDHPTPPAGQRPASLQLRPIAIIDAVGAPSLRPRP